jgi:DNA repair protein RadA/Sms
VAVLTKRAGLNLSSSDIYVNIVGGLRVSEPAADLAIILSVASALQDTQVPHGLVAFGEVGLSGEVRSVNQASRRVAEATKLGYKLAIGPAYGAVSGMKGVSDIASAVKLLSSRS